MSNRTHVQASSLGNDAILQRLDYEHATAFENGLALAEADVEINGDVMMLPDDWQPSDWHGQTAAGNAASKASHAAWLAFESLGYPRASFAAETTEGLMHKARVLRRAAQGLSAAELMLEPRLRLIAISLIEDALAF
jgi:hypothetical protein